MRILTVGPNDAGQRLDKFLSKAVKNLPVSLMYKSIRTKKIKVNRKRAEISQTLYEGDTVQLFLAEDIFGDAEKTGKISTVKSLFSHVTPIFDVVFEDCNLLIVYKPAGLSVHADTENDTNNLLTQIQAYLYKKGEYDPEAEQSFAPSLCNRIDRNTEGIVVAAKNAAALREADRLIKERLVTKKYLCAVHGEMPKKTDTLKAYLRKDDNNSTVRVFDNAVKGAKEILTKYRVIDVKDGLSLLEVELLTGRTHQIRAHMAYIGHPLLGDGKYGKNKEDRAIGYAHQALCSYYLKISGAESPLDTLNGREFTVKKEKIGFLSLFD